MRMWQLFCNEQVVDTEDLKTNVYEEAHTYFRLRKNLNHESFNKLFVVKEYGRPRKSVGNIEWWREESTSLDDFQKGINMELLLTCLFSLFVISLIAVVDRKFK